MAEVNVAKMISDMEVLIGAGTPVPGYHREIREIIEQRGSEYLTGLLDAAGVAELRFVSEVVFARIAARGLPPTV